MLSFAVPASHGPVRGTFEVPPSKSIHQRALVLAVLAEGTTWLEAGGLVPQDVRRLAAALSALTGRPVPPTGAVEGAVGPSGLGAGRSSLRLDLGMNATGLRALVAVAGLRPVGSRTLLTGAPRLRARPHRPLLRAIRRLGGHARRRPSGALRVLGARWTRHDVALPSEASSQYASALLLAAPRAGGLRLDLVGEAVSGAYLHLTEHALRSFAVPFSHEGGRFEVAAAAPRAARVVVEPDASSAATWWAAAAMTAGRVQVKGLPASSAQPDLALLPVLERMGAVVRRTGDGGVEVEGPEGGLGPAGDVDLRDTPDLAPLVGALAATARGRTRVVRAPHLRHKETDRVATVVRALRALGAKAEEGEDGFTVEGGQGLRGAPVAVAGDHRLALAFGVLGLAVPGVVLEGAEAVDKSYPGFLDDLARAAGGA